MEKEISQRELEAERPVISEKVFLKCDVSLRFQRISSVSEAESVCCSIDGVSGGHAP